MSKQLITPRQASDRLRMVAVKTGYRMRLRKHDGRWLVEHSSVLAGDRQAALKGLKEAGVVAFLEAQGPGPVETSIFGPSGTPYWELPDEADVPGPQNTDA